MANRLVNATSPYLLQHADNPVDWWEWGDAAFAEARHRDVPVLLSVGYAACHWCHVMAHESFEDPATAELLNSTMVSIKVDREERPDVDAVYMDAVQALTGQGGWPMTVFLTPDGQPFFAGTYFPPRPMPKIPSFTEVVEAVTDAWTTRRGDVAESAAAIAQQLGAPRHVAPGTEPPTPEQLDAAVLRLSTEFDAEVGGFGGAPKFPPSMVLEFLIRHHARTGDTAALAMVERTCDRWARGGTHDQLGGGFARYSVDAGWVVPHFEKMLYDNALLLRVYSHLWRSSERSDVRDQAEHVVRGIAEFLRRDLTTPEGGFASSLDADSPPADGQRPTEGAAYVWNQTQLREVLGDTDGQRAAEVLGVTDHGTFEHGASTLRMLADPWADADDAHWWNDVRHRLLAARDRRPQPAVDDKVVAAWNGLAIAALAEAGALFDEPSWIDAAVAAADVIILHHVDDRGRLLRVSRSGASGTSAGVLEDYADVAEGFHALLAVTGDPVWLELADNLLGAVLAHFRDPETRGFFDTADDDVDTRLASVRRPQDPTDNATPSGWSAAAGALLTHAAYTGELRYREAAADALATYARLAEHVPRFAGWGLAVAEAMTVGPAEVAVVGAASDPDRNALHRTALQSTSPGAAVAIGSNEPPQESEVPLLRDRPLLDGRATAYVCRGFVCRQPTTDPEELATQLIP